MQAAPSAIIPGKTRPGTKEAEAAKSGRMVVKGILYSDDKPSAIIDTQIVHEGDKIYGATVVKINKDSVEFEIEGKKEKKGVEP
jgi:type II secretory pathway component PulC